MRMITRKTLKKVTRAEKERDNGASMLHTYIQEAAVFHPAIDLGHMGADVARDFSGVTNGHTVPHFEGWQGEGFLREKRGWMICVRAGV
jgi:hypothetical protein